MISYFLHIIFVSSQLFSFSCYQPGKWSNLNSQINSKHEQKLIDYLFTDYNTQQKPSGTVHVSFALNLNSIVNVLEKDQIFMLNAFVDHEWTDKRLSWDPEDYDNITLLRINGVKLWIPDTFVYTTADQSGFLLPQPGAYFVVNYDGKIFWPNPLTEMKVRCSMGIAWFPYDDQLCLIVIGSWSHTVSYLNYSTMNENSMLRGYTENNEWSLIDFKAFREEIYYDNWIEEDLFSNINYHILIKRKPLFVLQNFCIPAFMLCIITLCSFFMPFPQEMQIGISIVLSFSVFKLRLSDDVPPQSDAIPLINIYYVGCMAFSLSAMVWFFIINLMRENIEQNKKIPNCIRYLVLRIICVLLCTKNFKTIKAPKIMKPSSSIEHQKSKNLIKKDSSFTIPEEPLLFKENVITKIGKSESFYENYQVGVLSPEVEDQKIEISDNEIIDVLNRFGFCLFFLFIVSLNIMCLIVFPYFIKKPLTIDG